MGRRKSDSLLYDLFHLPCWVSALGLAAMVTLYAFWSIRSANSDVGIFKPMLLVISMLIQIGTVAFAIGLLFGLSPVS